MSAPSGRGPQAAVFEGVYKDHWNPSLLLGCSGNRTPHLSVGPRQHSSAAREHADVLILECMAVRPELQGICQDQIVKSHCTVITNLRYDHLFKLGGTREEITRSFCYTVPEGGTLFLADRMFGSVFKAACEKRRSTLVQCAPPRSLAPQEENQYIVEQVCAYLGFQSHPAIHVEDFGSARRYTFRGNAGQRLEFINLFSVNDPESTLLQLREVERRPSVILYNHRPDRPDRFLLFQKHFFPKVTFQRLIIMGRGGQLPVRLLKKQGIFAERCDWRNVFDLPDHTLIIGIGNIKGAGEKLILELERRERHE